MADAGPGGHLELLGTVVCLTRGGLKLGETPAAGLRVGSSDGDSSSGCWCWWQLLQRRAAWAPRRMKAQHVWPGLVAASLRGLLRGLATWSRRPKPLEEVPLLVLERAQGAT